MKKKTKKPHETVFKQGKTQQTSQTTSTNKGMQDDAPPSLQNKTKQGPSYLLSETKTNRTLSLGSKQFFHCKETLRDAFLHGRFPRLYDLCDAEIMIPAKTKIACDPFGKCFAEQMHVGLMYPHDPMHPDEQTKCASGWYCGKEFKPNREYGFEATERAWTFLLQDLNADVRLN